MLCHVGSTTNYCRFRYREFCRIQKKSGSNRKLRRQHVALVGPLNRLHVHSENNSVFGKIWLASASLNRQNT